MIMISAIKKATRFLKKLFCTEGRSPDNLTNAFINANDNAREKSTKVGKELRVERKEKEKLEKELARKEKALAEAAALLVLRKKADAIWGTDEEDE